jgi:hypothetical protein
MMNHDLLESDHLVHEVHTLLPQLFRCRSIGDGFGAIINAIEIAFVNRRGEPLNEKQIVTLLRVLKELRGKPFIRFESALRPIEELTRVGFEVDPPILSELLDAPE